MESGFTLPYLYLWGRDLFLQVNYKRLFSKFLFYLSGFDRKVMEKIARPVICHKYQVIYNYTSYMVFFFFVEPRNIRNA